MKKIFIIILTLVCFGGIGYLGYIIFNAKSIESVEIAGNMQTMYVVGQDLNFQDAKLKVTYKNGNIKMVDITDDNVDVSLFSTSLQAHGKMKLTYKSEVLEVDYDVINKGLYYVSSETLIKPSSTTAALPETFAHNSSPMLFYIDNNGKIDYYYKAGSRYYMHDGDYDSSYKYEIVGDTMNVYLGKDEVAYEIKAAYSSEGIMRIKTTIINTMDYDPDIVVSKEEKLFTFYEGFKTDRIISSAEVDLSQTPHTSQGSYKFVNFYVGETIKSSGKTLLLKTSYSNDTFLKTVYVYISDEMLSRKSLDTSKVTDLSYMRGTYEGEDFEINYTVGNN